MKKIFFLFIPVIFLASSSCKKERTPIERIDLTDGNYAINCLNCKPFVVNGNIVNYSSIETRLSYKTKKAEIGNDAYLQVNYAFSDGTKGDFIVNRSRLSIADGDVSFVDSWAWGPTSNLHLDLILYSGHGSKSNILGIDIPRPSGANRMASGVNTSISDKPSFGGYIPWE